jgi:hypothetical protein
MENAIQPVKPRCAATIKGVPCKAYPIKGRKFCGRHGGLSLIGPDTPAFKHGLGSQNRKRFSSIGKELLTRIEELREDPDLFSLKDDAAYMTALIDRRAEAAAEGFGIEVFNELRILYRSSSRAYKQADWETFSDSFDRMGEIFESGGNEAKATNEVVDLITKRVELVEAEQRVAHAKAYTLEVDQAYSLVMQVIGIVKQSVRNADELTAIKAGVGKLLKVYQQDIDNNIIDAEVVDEEE